MLCCACDVGPAEVEPGSGPALHLLASWPLPWAGLNCALEELDVCGVDPWAPIELRFDRFLLPSAVVRQAIVVSAGSTSVLLAPRYDVLERVVRFLPVDGKPWRLGTRYDVTVRLPGEGRDSVGFRAFDGAPLVRKGSAPLSFSFRIRTGQPASAPLAPQVDPSFEEIAQLFKQGGCAQAPCHQSQGSENCTWGRAESPDGSCVDVPRMGLDLSSPELARHGLQQVARETEWGPQTGVPLENPSRFGVAMPRVEEGRPDNSYLIYKLLGAPALYQDPNCASEYSVAPGDCPQPPEAELSRLGNWFLLGQAMPIPMPDQSDAEPHPELALRDLRMIRRWIWASAPGLH